MLADTLSDTYAHSESELLGGSGQIVILCFKSFTLTVKNMPLYTPFCAERNHKRGEITFILIPLSHDDDKGNSGVH